MDELGGPQQLAAKTRAMADEWDNWEDEEGVEQVEQVEQVGSVAGSNYQKPSLLKIIPEIL